MIHGEFQSCLIDIDRDSEFSGDDVDQYSKLVDLGRHYEKLLIIVPALTSSALNIYVQELASTATVPSVLHKRKTSDESTVAWATTAGTGDYAIVCDCLGGFRYVRIRATTNQAADRTFRVCGVRS